MTGAHLLGSRRHVIYCNHSAVPPPYMWVSFLVKSSHVLQTFFFIFGKGCGGGARGVTSVISSCTSLQAPVLRSLLAETDYFQLSRTYLSDINLEERFDC